jgi:hypothetical protein
MAKFYAWSDLYNGGSVEKVTLPNGGVREVVVERNIVPRGAQVSKGKLKLSDADWDALVAGGSVRTYPLPEEADENTSPNQAVLRRLSKGSGEIDQDMLLELALSQPVVNPSAEDAAELPIGA